MAGNFIDAVKALHAKLKSVEQGPPSISPEDVARIALAVVHPVMVETIKQNNVAVVRVLRDNPALLSRAR